MIFLSAKVPQKKRYFVYLKVVYSIISRPCTTPFVSLLARLTLHEGTLLNVRNNRNALYRICTERWHCVLQTFTTILIHVCKEHAHVLFKHE